uniref:Tripartite motif-containing protein 16-like n=1 Tax=Oryzias sinensis TaxID=183150 RepID=A0A8C8DHU2_9TELE
MKGWSLSCSVCLGLLEDPTTLPCGHSYCMSCIRTYWSKGNQRRTPSCPQCRRTLTFRPLVEQKKTSGGKKQQFGPSASQKDKQNICPHHNEELKTVCRTDQQFICYVCLMVKHRGHEAAQIAEERFEKQKKLQETRQRAQKKIKDCEQAVKELQQEVEDINTAADKSVEDSEEIFSEMIRLLQNRSSEVKQQIRSQQEDEVNRVLDLQEKLEQEIRDLKSKDGEMQQLSHTEDHSQFLHRYPSLSALSESTHSSSFHLSPRRYFQEATAAVADTRDKLQELLRDKRANISQKFFSFIHISSFFINLILITFTMEKNFLKYSELTLDPNTAHPRLELSAANRKATFTHHRNDHHWHPDRFTFWTQVLSRESLTGRHYWEVEWTGGAVYIAVTYKNIQTSQYDQAFGSDDKSWALYCDRNSYIFYHKDMQTCLSGPGSSRVGVYLDHGAGVLAFYSVSETMTLLHRVQTTFTQPLHAGLRLSSGLDSIQTPCPLLF